MKYLIFMIAAVAMAAVNGFAQCSEADKATLIKFDKDWTAANAAGDRNTIAAFYADEFTAFPAMTGKAVAVDTAVTTAARNRANPQPLATTVSDHYMVTCTPLTGTVTHRNITTPAGGGQPTHGRSIHFFEKRGGRWVVVSNAGGPINDSDILRYMELDWIEAVKKRNYDWMEKNIASDYTEISFVTGDVSNKRQTIDGLKADKTVFDVMEVSDLNIRVDGNTGIVIGKGYARGKMGDGKPFDMTLRFTDAYIKRDGRWQAWASQATMVPPPQATAGK